MLYRVIGLHPTSYTGFSRKLAFNMARAHRKAGSNYLIRVRRDGVWRDIAEQVFA